MAAVQASSRFPERCIIARPLDLPHLNPFVYIVSAPKTSPAAIKQAMAFYGSKGKLPIYLRNEISDEFTDSLLRMFHIEVGRLREQNILGETDVQDFVSWGPHLCGTLLISAIQPALNVIPSNSCTDRAEDVPGAQVINGSQF
jgi:3-hydroxyacyl-CoA dehydrogenase